MYGWNIEEGGGGASVHRLTDNKSESKDLSEC